jgi:para-aminobenzoate synthetase/4-amino-4-deoxychorismate lyase
MIPLRKETLKEYLDQISSGYRTTQRVRVLLDQDGKLDAESSAFDLLEIKQVLRVRLAREPVQSGNVFLFHKTTRREVYEAARQGLEDRDDVLLYNEKGELTECTIGNLVVELEGRLFTPPISCGVLAGTFRAHLLETGQVVERTIPIEQLNKCTRVFRVNSVRGWQIVEIDHQNTGLNASVKDPVRGSG